MDGAATVGGHHVHDHAVHRLPGAADDDAHGTPPARGHHHGLDGGNRLHIDGDRVQPERLRAASAHSNTVTPTGRRHPRRRQCDRNRRDRSGARELDARRATAGRSPTTRSPRTSAHAQAPVRSTAAPRPRRRSPAYQRHQLHVHRYGEQRARDRPASAHRARSPRRTRSSTSRPPRRSTRRHQLGRARRAVQLGSSRAHHRHPLLQGHSQHRHPHRQPVERSGTLLASATFTDETTSGWQTGQLLQSRGDHRRHHLRRRLPAPKGHYSVPPRPSPARVNNAPLTALPTPPARTACSPTAPPRTFPTSTFNAANYWVDVLFTRAARPPGQVTASRRLRGPVSANVNWTRPGGGAVASTRSPRTSAQSPQTPTTLTRQPAPPA